MTNLENLPIGTVVDNQTLIEKKRDGQYQLWQSNTTEKFGVVRIEKNGYIVILPATAGEDVARLVFCVAGENIRPF